MATGELQESGEISVWLTPGERFQNWLASHGVCDAVQPRDVHHPEPPTGLWVFVNGTAALGTIAGAICILWLTLAYAIPALANVRVL